MCIAARAEVDLVARLASVCRFEGPSFGRVLLEEAVDDEESLAFREVGHRLSCFGSRAAAEFAHVALVGGTRSKLRVEVARHEFVRG